MGGSPFDYYFLIIYTNKEIRMAEFVPQKHEATDFNGGQEYIGENLSQGIRGDEIQADDINNLVESALYSQTVAELAKNLVESVVVNAFAPPLVGMHHIQFSGEPTPAEIWGGTTWEIDTAYQGRVLVGSGGSYSLGATGGEETHPLTIEEMPNHSHTENGEVVGYKSGGGLDMNWVSEPAGSFATSTGYQTSTVGSSQPHNNMPPYKVVNYWKRTA